MSTLDHPLLPEAEIRSLIAAYRTGDNDSAARVIAHNEKAVWRIARRYQATGVCGDVPMDDLMQLGRMGILRAMQDFNLDGDTKFLTYAWAWIRQSVSRYGKHEGQQVSMSYRASEHRGTVGKVASEFVQAHHRKPTRAEIAARTGFTEKYIGSLRAATVSLDEPLETNGSTFSDLIPDPNGNNPADTCEDSLLLATVRVNLKKLTPRRRAVIVQFFGLDGKTARDLKTIARKMGTSAENVRQLRDAAIEELKMKCNY